MKSTNTIILIGGIHLNHKPTCGETMKNQLFLKRFNELFEHVIPIDTYEWKKHPLFIFKLFFTLISHPKAKVIISGSRASRFLIYFLYYFPINRNAYFWVVGGDLHIGIEKGLYNVHALNKLVFIPVQGKSMVQQLSQLGVHNAIYVPNSKPITYHPTLVNHPCEKPFRFVFVSRIHPDKGIKEIYEASLMLNSAGLKSKYYIDFYGSIDPNYVNEFNDLLSQNQSLKYKGYLDFTTNAGYKQLSTYDIMLFPTYWQGEGFPGVVIDANIAGVPIIASDWNLNREVIEDNKTGFIIPAHDSLALLESMKKVIKNDIDLFSMKKNCNDYIQQYDYRNVLSIELMKKLKLYE